MRLLSSFVVSLALCPFAWAAPADSSCFIKVTNAETARWHAGSGTVIACENGQSLIMSCTHVIPDDKDVITVWHDGKVYDAKLLAASKIVTLKDENGVEYKDIEGADLSLIVVNVKLPVAKIAKDMPKIGDRVRQWGFAGGKTANGPYYKEGKVLDIEELYSTSDARRGDSGCGLFNDKDELIGVVNSRLRDEDAVGGYAVSVVSVRTWLKGKLDKFPELKKNIGD